MYRRTRFRAAILTLASAAVLVGCSHFGGRGKKPDAAAAYEERPVEALYNAGADDVDKHRWSDALGYFEEVERQHPYSEWARRSILMSAFSHYEANQYPDAIADADRFVSLYPGNPSAGYAYYLKAQCYFEQIVDVQRDQGSTEQALAALREVMRRYPATAYAVDSKLKVDMVNDQLGGKEMAIGRWYLRQGVTLAAIGRFKTVIDRYQTTTHTPEALYRLIEAYLTLGLRDEAVKDGAVLGYNFPGDRWYGEAYTLLTSKGLRPATPPRIIGGGGFRIPLPRVGLPHFGRVAPPPKTT